MYSAGLISSTIVVVLLVMLAWHFAVFGNQALQASRRTFAMFAIGASAFIATDYLPENLWSLPIYFLDSITIWLFWVFCYQICRDKNRPSPLQLIVFCAYCVVFLAQFIVQQFSQWLIWPLSIIEESLQVLFIIAIISELLYQYSDDLVAIRRSFRKSILYLFVCCIICATVLPYVIDIYDPKGLGFLLFRSMLIACLLTTWWLYFQAQTKNEPTKISTDEKPTPRNDYSQMVSSIRQQFDQQCYRNNQLTIGVLATLIKQPEYKVRQCINGEMGYRNFNVLLNEYRIGACKQRLADPEQKRVPILTIALDEGYNSLSTFNKAFKEQTGQTPSAFRKNH